MKFGELARTKDPDLVVSPRHEAWIRDNSNPEYSHEAVEFARQQLSAVPRVRKGTISASSLGSCRRRQMFTFLGWRELRPTSKTAAIFHNGTMMHIRWQMAGLTEGWLLAAEVPVPTDNQLNLSGTQDGVAYDGSLVELKSINSNGFRGVNTYGVKEEHSFQVGSYMVATGVEKSVVIYEDKDTQEYREFVVPLTDKLKEDVIQISEEVWGYVENKQLPEPLAQCEDKTGWRYNSCPFRDRCLVTKNWEHAEEQT